MQLVVACDAQHSCFAFSCYHQPLPCLRTLLDVGQFLDVMNFKVSSLFLAIFTLASVLSSQKFASACVLECEGRCVYFALEDRFALHVVGTLSPFPRCVRVSPF